MCRLIESIQVNDGQLLNVVFHEERIQRSSSLLWNSIKKIDFIALEKLASYCNKGIYKCRLVYDQYSTQISFTKYQRRPIQSLRLIHADDINYKCKYEDRSVINNLFKLKGVADDILIIKDGKITDTSYCNVALYDGKDWITPKNPLLKGTKRSELIINEILIEKDIRMDDLHNYKDIMLFNAMINPFELILDIKKNLFL